MASLDTGATLQADTVVLCMGPWTGRGLRWGGVDRELVSGSRAHSITLQLQDPATSAIDNTALFLSSLKEPEVYPRPDGTVYMCGGCSSDHAPLPPHPREVAVDTAACAQIKETAACVSAELGAVTRYTPSACYLPHSEDGAPLIGHLDQVTTVTSDQVIVRRSNLSPQVPGLVVAAGHSCWGILQGPATGEAVAELLVLGAASHVDLRPFCPGRFSRK